MIKPCGGGLFRFRPSEQRNPEPRMPPRQWLREQAVAPGGQIGILRTIRKCLRQRKGPCVCPNALSCLFLSSGPQSWKVTGRDRRAETHALLREQMPWRGHSLSALTRLCLAAQVRTPWGPSSLVGGAFVFSRESGYFLGNCAQGHLIASSAHFLRSATIWTRTQR